MAIERSREFILAALFLSRCGRQGVGARPLPPRELHTDEWSRAYAIFYDALSAGRPLRSFHNSLKATRDQFDSHVVSGRRGWRNADGFPKPLPSRDRRILDRWRDRPDSDLWQAVRPFADLAVSSIAQSVLDDLAAEGKDEDEMVRIGQEGREKALISRWRERSPRLRAAALKIHGYDCQVCGFNFGAVYGGWGDAFAEVHHLRELGSAPQQGRETDAARDLAVVCSNCHRMIHRRKKKALTLDELREMIQDVRQDTVDGAE